MSAHPERERAKAIRNGRGRPPRDDRPKLLARFEQYIDAHDFPAIAEFSYQNDVSRQQLYEWPEFTDALERCRNKKEANLEIGALYNRINVRQAIFSLSSSGGRIAASRRSRAIRTRPSGSSCLRRLRVAHESCPLRLVGTAAVKPGSHAAWAKPPAQE